MQIELVDVQCGFGPAPGVRIPLTANELLAEMQRIGIAQALVRLLPAGLHFDVAAGNDVLFGAGASSPALIPCPVVVPGVAHDLPADEVQVDEAICRGSGAVSIRPRSDCWSLAPWACDSLFRALSARRMPVLCSGEEVTLEEVGAIAGRHPALPLIVAGAGYRQQRIVAPLMESFANVYLSIGSNYCVHRGIEALVATVGPNRLLFGTGFPDVDMMPSASYLAYASIPDDAKALIGAENLRRLMREVIR